MKARQRLAGSSLAETKIGEGFGLEAVLIRAAGFSGRHVCLSGHLGIEVEVGRSPGDQRACYVGTVQSRVESEPSVPHVSSRIATTYTPLAKRRAAQRVCPPLANISFSATGTYAGGRPSSTARCTRATENPLSVGVIIARRPCPARRESASACSPADAGHTAT